jgi:hypothetical protein
VQPTLAAHFVLEMLHRIGDEHLLAINASLGQSAIQDTTGGSDERQAGQIFLVARLFADQHHRSPPRPLPRHRLRGVPVKRAPPAFVLGGAQGR